MSLLLNQLADALRAMVGAAPFSDVRTARIVNACAVLEEFDAQKDDLDAAAIIVHAYARGESRGGSIDWDDLNRAWLKAKDELGPERCGEIEDCYKEDDDETA